MKGMLLALSSILLVTLAQLALRVAMVSVPPVSHWLSRWWMAHPAASLLLGAGLAAYGLSMLCWLLALRHLPLNRLYPLLSLSYVLVWLAAVSLPVFNEPFRWSSLAGVILIMLGLLLNSWPRNKARR